MASPRKLRGSRDIGVAHLRSVFGLVVVARLRSSPHTAAGQLRIRTGFPCGGETAATEDERTLTPLALICSTRAARARFRYHRLMAGGQPTKNRFLKLLRKTTARTQKTGGRSAESDGALWTTHERAAAAARLGGEASQRVAAALAKSRATLDAIADQARASGARREEL
ncbi:hypothetical protein BH09MYX1_BH09MYX1_08680 [soil metagenome]